MRRSAAQIVADKPARPRWAVWLGVIALVMSLPAVAHAQRELRVIPDPDPEEERRSFQVADGLEVNLFAADPMLAKPIHMNFDAQGRLWIATSEVYPHVKPGQEANDKILVLEDADADGRAEKTTVFADGLLIPTAVEPGDGGAYVANSTEMLHLADTDGDGRADRRRVMLSGFGTEDTHHIIHTFRWGPDGMLYFNQSIYIHSHIETPHGVRRLNSGGVWQFRPETMQLEVFSRGLCNPWGHIFDRWGQSFETDGAGGEGINYSFPGATMFTYAGAKKILRGLNPGSPKHCGLEVISGRHFPDDWQGSLVTNDFRAHRVCRFVVSESGAGYVSRQQPEIIKTAHAAFRPVDVKMGPDGALYIADWYNPIIQHGEVDFRDQRRDHTHGRIWRVTAKGRSLVERPKLVDAPVEQLLEALQAPEDFTRLHAKLQLKARGRDVLPQLAGWVAALDAADPQYDERRVEALWTYQALDVPEPTLLTSLLRSADHRVRAAATRVLRAWRDSVPQAAQLLSTQVADEHPQVRLEAVRALAELNTSQAAELAMRALDRPLDRFLEHGLWLAARDLAPAWLPALTKGEFDCGGNVRHLTFLLQSADSPAVVGPLMDMLRAGKLPRDRQESVLVLVAALGKDTDLRAVFDMALDEQAPAAARAELLDALVGAARMRKVRPAGSLGAIAGLVDAPDAALRRAAIEAAGVWQMESLRERLLSRAKDETTDAAERRATLASVAGMGPASTPAILALCKPDQLPPLRAMAICALAALDVQSAAAELVNLMRHETSLDPTDAVVTLMDRRGGAAALTEALNGQKLPDDVAKLAVRAARSVAREEPALIGALSAAGGISGGARTLSQSELKALIDEVASSGDAERGEAVFRRADQACFKCHAIAGAGGRVGPDLVSIGASAQVDYLIESILQPSAKIKENYHSLVVVADGRITSGVLVRETDKELVLRDVEDRDVAIPLDAIEERANGGSLMPLGLADTLTRAELVDLLRFLSELGKVGRYAVSSAPVVRRWQALTSAPQAAGVLAGGLPEKPPVDEPGGAWVSCYSAVSGELPLATVPVPDAADGDQSRCVLRCQCEVARAGKIGLKFSGAIDKLWFDDQPIATEAEAVIDATAGTHTVTLIAAKGLDRKVRVELVDVPNSAAQIQLVGGK
ncbi:MAG: PVC-type heme-binding CxxCH protein [Pirellulales bacterium]